jgi:hypothetical protein
MAGVAWVLMTGAASPTGWSRDWNWVACLFFELPNPAGGIDISGTRAAYQHAVVYVEGDLEALTKLLGWKPVTSGANVSLLVPYDEGVFFDIREMDGTQLVTPIQIFLDLQAYRNRGQEAAQAIRKGIEQTW